MATDSLLVLTECRSALAEAKTLDDIFTIRDKAELVRRARKARGASLAVQNEAALITIEAEIALGETIPKLTKKGGDKKSKLRDVTSILSDLGISKIQSHRWQAMAAAKKQVPALLAKANAEDEDLTRSAVYRAGRKIQFGDKPKRDGKESWGPGEWISHLRQRVEDVYDEAPADFREIMANVLRTLAENVETWESSDDGSGRRNGETAAVA